MKKLLLSAFVHTSVTHIIRSTLLLLVVATAAYGGVPPVNVIVSDASDKVVFKGTTNVNATFETGNLRPGHYVVQFNSKAADLKGNQYLLVVSAGKKKVIADAVPGERFNGNGVAMRVTVGAGLKITGQVATDQVMASAGSAEVKVINGKRYVWVKARTGSNIGDHWEEENLAPGYNIVRMEEMDLRKLMDRQFEGSMLDRPMRGP
jgi:hypothetical protein